MNPSGSHLQGQSKAKYSLLHSTSVRVLQKHCDVILAQMSSKGIKRQVKKENTNATITSIIWNPIKEEFTALFLTLIACLVHTLHPEAKD